MAEVEKKVLLKESIAPSISQERREEPKVEPEEPEVLVAKPIARTKKSPWSKLAKTFIKEDLHSVGKYVLIDVIVPGAKDLLQSILHESVDIAFNGHINSGYSDRNSNGHIPYNSLSTKNSRPSRAVDTSSVHEVEFYDPIYPFKQDADKTVEYICNWVNNYGKISVAKVKKLTKPKDAKDEDLSHNWVDNDWGWEPEELDYITVRKVREGYRIFFPEPVCIKH